MASRRRELIEYVQRMPPSEFEKLVGELWKLEGWDTQVTPKSNDRGIDIIATRDEFFSQKHLIQVKRYSNDTSVSTSEVQQYATLRQQETNVDAVIIVTSGRFTEPAENLAKQLNIKLVNKETLIDLIEKHRGKIGEDFDILRENNGSPQDKKINAIEESSQRPILWQQKLRNKIKSSPVLVNGILVVGDIGGNIYGFDKHSGNSKWVVNTGGNIHGNLHTDGRRIYLLNSFPRAVALDASSGKVEWTYELSSSAKNYGVQSAPVTKSGKVYFGGTSSTQFYCLDSDSGGEIWRFDKNGASSTPYIGNSCIFATSSTIYALDPDSGRQKWSFNYHPINLCSPPKVNNGKIYVAGKFDNDRHNSVLLSIDKNNGDEVSRFVPQTNQTSSAFHYFCEPIFDSNRVYFGNSSHLFAVNNDTSEGLWKLMKRMNTTPTIDGDNIYFGGRDALYVIEKNSGKSDWKFETGDRVTTSPLVNQGLVYIGSDKKIYCLRDVSALHKSYSVENSKLEEQQENRSNGLFGLF